MTTVLSTRVRFSDRRNGKAVPSPPITPAKRDWLGRRLLLLVAVLIGGVLLTYTIWPRIAYRLTHIVSREASVQGVVTPVGARFEGRISRVEVRPGERVVRGQLLVALENEHLKARRQKAVAVLEGAEAHLTAQRARLAHQRKVLAVQVQRATARREVASAELDETRTRFERWQHESSRVAALHRQGASTSSELDRVHAAQKAAQADVEAAEARRRYRAVGCREAELTLKGLTVEEGGLAVLEAEVAQARSAVGVAEAQLEASYLRAPEEALVVACDLGPGASVRAGQAILTLWLGRSVWVEARIPQRDLRRTVIGSPAEVALEAHPDHVWQGRVESVGPTLPGGSRSQTAAASVGWAPSQPTTVVRIRLDGETAGLLQPGLAAVVGIDTGQTRTLREALLGW